MFAAFVPSDAERIAMVDLGGNCFNVIGIDFCVRFKMMPLKHVLDLGIGVVIVF